MFTVIRDNKEKQGYWDFTIFDECEGQLVQHLKTGDYTLLGFENKVIIERKRTTGEIAINLGSKFKQFKNECSRMQEWPEKYVVCEFDIDDVLSFPKNSGIPPSKLKFIRMNGKFMLLRIHELETEFGVKFLFCKDKQDAEQTVLEIFNNVINNASGC